MLRGYLMLDLRLPLCLLVLAATLVMWSPVAAEQPRGRVVEYGVFVYDLASAQAWNNAATTSQVVWEGGQVQLVQRTQRVPLVKDIYFAFQYVLSGLPEGEVELLWTVEHPPIEKPDGTVSTGYSYSRTEETAGGQVAGQSGYVLNKDFELVPGTWVFSYSYAGKVLVRQEFQVYRP